MRRCSRLGLIACALFWCAAAVARGGGGGHVTKFDANLFPGATVKNFITDYSATCNGVADDSTALASWVSDATAHNPTLYVLYIPPGSKCRFASNNGFQWGGTLGAAGIQNYVVWGYGASIVSNVGFQSETMYQDNSHNGLIQSASAGASTVTLITAGDASKFSVGSLVLIAGLELQNVYSGTTGFPPNFQFFEYRVITAINGGVLTLNTPLTNSYLSTWPQTYAGSSTYPQTGPATVYALPPSFQVNGRVYGLTMPTNAMIPNVQVNVSGRDMAFYDCVFDGHSPGAEAGVNQWYFYTRLGTQVEVDKNLDNLSVVRSYAPQILFQSAGVNNFLLDGSQIDVLNGTGINTTLRNSTIPQINLGPVFFGHGVSLSADGVSVTTAAASNQMIAKSALSYSSGMFSIANASISNALQWGVPGYKYHFIYYNGAQFDCANPFTITGVTTNGTTTSFVTDLAGALPSPTCGGQPYNNYLAYPSGSAAITQKFTGPADLTLYAAP